MRDDAMTDPTTTNRSASAGVVHVTRRELRLAETAERAGRRGAGVKRSSVAPMPVRRTVAVAPAARTTRPAAAKPRPRSRVALSALVMTFAAGLVATMALPSYAFGPASGSTDAGVTGAIGPTQQMRVGSTVSQVHAKRDSFSATSPAALKRATLATQFASYTGPTASDYIKNPAHPAFSLQAVYETAKRYTGVPYVFGGENPSGFDCSGFVMFVYAQYGVALQHSVHMQNVEGIEISPADAQPGDVVIFNDMSHDGFYAGNGNILHAPYPGASVREQPLWTNAVHFVRFGVKG